MIRGKSKFGKAFIDELSKVKVNSKTISKKNRSFSLHDPFMASEEDEDETELMSSWRKLILAVFIIIFFSVLFIRLFHLQVIQGQTNRELADSNRIQVKIIHASRGVIYDRNGKILANNEPGFRLIDKDSKKVTYLSREKALELETKADSRFQDLEIDNNRAYPLAKKAAHVIGYVGEITAEELKEVKYKGYVQGDKIGRSGIEESYEKVLKGVDGGEIIEVDAQGKKLRTIRKKEATAGQNLYLTIDADLQNISFDQLEMGIKKAKVCCGALVSEDPESGQILSLVSIPSFDPLDISSSLSLGNSPFLNRVIAGTYPPGSTFKIVSSLAGLISGKVNPETIFVDTGFVDLGPYKFTNWYFTQYGKTEGAVDLVKALKRSNDIYFYKVGELVGEVVLGEAAKMMGLSKKLGIDIPGEEVGLIPSNDWKVKNFNQVWYPGDSLHMAIGQGFVLSTPLQISYLISQIAADGKQYPPHLSLKITDPHDKLIKSYNYDPMKNSKIKDEYVKVIKKGLEEVTINGGTAWPFFTFPIKTAGKTGTAEYGDPQGATHAWYTAYGSSDDPKISVTVLVEKGGEGSSVASPIAKEIFRYFFSNDKKHLIKDTYEVATESAKILGE